MTNQILFSQLEADVHPFEWVSALLSEYKNLRQDSGIAPSDPDAESTMIREVESLIHLASKMTNQPDQEYSSGDVLLDDIHANAPSPYDP